MTAKKSPGHKSAAQLQREINAHLAATSVVHSNPRPGYREVGTDGAPWPTWLTALKHTAGAYVIRDKASGQVLYVGSARWNLYDTVSRHFQTWKRSKKFWKGAYGHAAAAGGHESATDHDPGMTYKRGRCEVAVYLTSKGEHLEEEALLIQKLKPRDNLVYHPDGDDEPVPF